MKTCYQSYKIVLQLLDKYKIHSREKNCLGIFSSRYAAEKFLMNNPQRTTSHTRISIKPNGPYEFYGSINGQLYKNIADYKFAKLIEHYRKRNLI
jgi:hypothetical protein